jgi:hypothetical protein
MGEVRGLERRTGPGGWTVFAAAWLSIAGVFNLLNGLTAIRNDSFYAPQLLFSNLNAWGYLLLLVGVLQLVAAYRIYVAGGTALGVGMCTFSMIVLWFLFFAYPMEALMGFVINGMAIYGLTVGRAPR